MPDAFRRFSISLIDRIPNLESLAHICAMFYTYYKGLSISKLAKHAGFAHTVLTQRMRADYEGSPFPSATIERLGKSVNLGFVDKA